MTVATTVRHWSAILCSAATLGTHAGPGALDAGFGTGGIRTFDFAGWEYASRIAMAPDGRFHVLGGRNSDWDYRLTRHAADGAIEAMTFVGFPSTHCAGCSSFIVDMARQADGRVVLLGSTSIPNGTGPVVKKVFVVRYQTNGLRDATFGAGRGIVVIQPEGNTDAQSLHLRADDGIVLSGQAGSGVRTADPTVPFGGSRVDAGRWMIVGLTRDGLPDASFGAGGIVRPDVVHGPRAPRTSMQSDGRIVAAGESPAGFFFARLSPTGAVERQRPLAVPANDGVAVQSVAAGPDNRTWIGTGLANGSLYQGTLMRLTPAGDDDPTFTGFPGWLPDLNLQRIVPLPDGGALVETWSTLTGLLPSLSLLRFAPDGSVASAAGDEGFIRLYRLSLGEAAVLSDGKVLAVGSWSGPAVNQYKPAVYRIDLQSHAFVASGFIEFGAQSWGTASQPVNLTVRNTTSSPRAISVTSSAGFPASTDCAELAAGTSCTVSIRHQPAAPGATLGAYTLTSGSAAITGGNDLSATVAMTGAVSYALVDHYYRSALRRAPDGAGRQFWVNQAIRIRNAFQSLSGAGAANVSEAWYALAMTFFGSAEYAAYQRSDTGFVGDLYRTFFDREPENAGLAYWTSLLAGGLPRDAVLAGFMFSAEFIRFNTTFYGGAPNRPEIDVVMDLYRGFLARLPDDAGLGYWVGRMQQAQCSGAQAVYEEVDALSSQFASSPEYIARARGTPQHVTDLYNAFMRRGADAPGVGYWVGRIDSGASSREDARRSFIASAEFSARVQAIIGTGCRPQAGN